MDKQAIQQQMHIKLMVQSAVTAAYSAGREFRKNGGDEQTTMIEIKQRATALANNIIRIRGLDDGDGENITEDLIENCTLAFQDKYDLDDLISGAFEHIYDF